MADEPLNRLADIVIKGLAAGQTVEIDGLGAFYPDHARGFRFQPCPRPAIFIAYVTEDAGAAEFLYEGLADTGFNPWMDRRKLLPGQNWARAIERAIESSDLFLACFSSHSVNKRGVFQAEIRYALDCARRVPLDEIFLVPLRLDDCRVPRSIEKGLQYIDLFPDWSHGFRRLVTTIRREVRRKAAVPTV